jgi:hypothetical protein
MDKSHGKGSSGNSGSSSGGSGLSFGHGMPSAFGQRAVTGDMNQVSASMCCY